MRDLKFLLILDIQGISFHAVVVFGLGKNLLFKSILGRCEPTVFLKNEKTHCQMKQEISKHHKIRFRDQKNIIIHTLASKKSLAPPTPTSSTLISHCLANIPKPESAFNSPAAAFRKINMNSRNEIAPSSSSSTSQKLKKKFDAAQQAISNKNVNKPQT